MARLVANHCKLGEGASETGLRLDGRLVAVVTRPMAGARFFLHADGLRRPERFSSLAKAIARAEELFCGPDKFSA